MIGSTVLSYKWVIRWQTDYFVTEFQMPIAIGLSPGQVCFPREEYSDLKFGCHILSKTMRQRAHHSSHRLLLNIPVFKMHPLLKLYLVALCPLAKGANSRFLTIWDDCEGQEPQLLLIQTLQPSTHCLQGHLLSKQWDSQPRSLLGALRFKCISFFWVYLSVDIKFWLSLLST